MTVEERKKAMIEIFSAILFHLNGYSREDAKKYAASNEGHELWEEIHKILTPHFLT